ncbi:MAG: NADH:ubiquinone reductase (Na(+)-transporting) subunit B [Phycisphaeraceae bacterium]|nr:NADH:ubiquinone reductase (Na(+)-transporting) subunit B [Phycisphaeraceae bacterium]
MKLLRTLLDKIKAQCEPGAKLGKIHFLFEAIDTFAYTPGETTLGAPHVRDALDLKRMMITVFFALVPVSLMACYNTGLQANLATEAMTQTALATDTTALATIEGWRGVVCRALGAGCNSHNPWANFLLGLLYFLPVYIVTLVAGGVCETIFSAVRKHPIYEGFLVTSLLFPLILPPTIPLWQGAMGVSFGVIIGKEVFGGVGMNILNPALVGRVFLYFAYPGEISGDGVWVAVDGFTQATPLGALANGVALSEQSVAWWQAFVGLMPGSMGETSALACIVGAMILIVTKVGSWRIMSGVTLAMIGTTLLVNAIGSDSNLLFGMNPGWSFVLGGFAFGAVFMATDPVSAAHTKQGQWIYGLLIGFLTVLVRVINPAFPEGIMLAILFGNVFAPAIDKIFVAKNVKRRQLRNVAG